jgi:hypothetical protein
VRGGVIERIWAEAVELQGRIKSARVERREGASRKDEDDPMTAREALLALVFVMFGFGYLVLCISRWIGNS